MDSTHLDTWAAETHVPEGERAWFAWAHEAERIAGHDLDGEQSTDGYSLDYAYAAWKQGQTPAQYVASITAPEYRTPAIGAPVNTPDGPGIMAGVTGSRYAVTFPEGVPAIGMAAGSTMGYDPLSVHPATYADQVTRTIADLHHWGHMGMSGVEFTVTYGYPDAPDETQHLRIAFDVDAHEWKLYTLTHAHGDVDERAPFPRLTIDRAVIRRIANAPGAFVNNAPTRAFIEAFYADAKADA